MRGLRAAGVGTHQSGAEFGRYLGHRGIIAAPAVVDQIRARLAGEPRHLGSPGVDADQLVGIGIAQPLDERHHPGDLSLRVDGLPRAGLHPAHVDHVGTLGDQAVHGGPRVVVGEVRPAVVERIRGAVDDRHDQRALVAHRATAQGGLHTSIVPAAATEQLNSLSAGSTPADIAGAHDSETRCQPRGGAGVTRGAGGPLRLSPGAACRWPLPRDSRRRTGRNPRRVRRARRPDPRSRGCRPARADRPCGS